MDNEFPPKRKVSGCWIATSIVLFLVLGWCLLPVFLGDTKESAKRTQDLSNLKQIGTALSIYLTDNDDRFPPDTSSVHNAVRFIKPYLGSKLEGRWPVTFSLVPDCPQFLGNGSLALKATKQLSDPNHLIVFFDSGVWPSGQRNVLFADTGARRITEAGFQAAVRNDWRYAAPGVHE